MVAVQRQDEITKDGSLYTRGHTVTVRVDRACSDCKVFFGNVQPLAAFVLVDRVNVMIEKSTDS